MSDTAIRNPELEVALAGPRNKELRALFAPRDGYVVRNFMVGDQEKFKKKLEQLLAGSEEEDARFIKGTFETPLFIMFMRLLYTRASALEIKRIVGHQVNLILNLKRDGFDLVLN